MKKLTAEWVKKAEADFVAAGKLARGRVALHDQVCFHSQQAAEKYLKGLMAELARRFHTPTIWSRSSVC
jgi:HEPN domain-containing protein